MNLQNSTNMIQLLSSYLNHPERAQALFSECISHVMRQRNIRELLIVPIGFDDDGEMYIENNPDFAPTLHLCNCKSTPQYENNGICMFRLKLENDNLLFHGGDWIYWMEGDLDLSHIADESNEDPWLPISTFTNIQGLLNIAEFLLNNDTAWEYTTKHPESLFEGMVQAEIKRNNI